ncbi:PHP domain-containing protein [Leptolyngbya sp. FACHB-261]|uniref:PHP domain-containing protein n=1 Tax=Leptolyngbya sp. FACHB-261 TaxID=2692806 RepID=UPI00168805E7|nr:PHP domain-containing protein [Leptolyngbya sp. FACHB-261]MBD2103023.1 PHP domain-containing protein [Leptolyngbya sp. FACHB-261]
MLELHCHTTCSDGTLTPSELVQAAVGAGVRALAITDHDTLAGWDEALATAQAYDLEIVPGLELSTVHRGRSLHILGFYPNRDLLQDPLAERLAGRKRRAQEIARKLAELGYPIQLPTMGPGMAPGRPHIASALVQAGHVQSSREAFDRWLGEDKPAYVHYEKFGSDQGIALLRSCGAVPVWAHPYLFRGGDVEAVLPELVAVGLMGVEVYHPHHSPSESHKLERLCAQYGLLMTGGSDYHGPSQNRKDTDRSQLNMLKVPLTLLEPVRQAAAQLHSQLR